MRLQRPVHYSQIVAAVRPGACPLCAVLKDFQSAYIREADPQSLEALCNFHMWAFAGAAQAESAAKLFLRLLEEAGTNHSALPPRVCGICLRIREEEVRRLDEFAEKFAQDKFREWMLVHGTVCMPHAIKLRPRLPAELQVSLAKILARREEELRTELEELLRNVQSGQRGHEGILGKVAESLAAQRGLEPK